MRENNNELCVYCGIFLYLCLSDTLNCTLNFRRDFFMVRCGENIIYNNIKNKSCNCNACLLVWQPYFIGSKSVSLSKLAETHKKQLCSFMCEVYITPEGCTYPSFTPLMLQLRLPAEIQSPKCIFVSILYKVCIFDNLIIIRTFQYSHMWGKYWHCRLMRIKQSIMSYCFTKSLMSDRHYIYILHYTYLYVTVCLYVPVK